jgi:hypothetical protein
MKLEAIETDFCTYCNDVHEMVDFGYDFSGKRVLVCSDQTADALAGTMPKVHDGLDVDVLQERRSKEAPPTAEDQAQHDFMMGL